MRTNTELNTVLNNLAEFLDIPESYFERARARYQAIGNWLERDDSNVSEFSPLIYPQGSFRLGTVTKPLSNTDDYDIDLVCRVSLSKAEITQKKLKELIGSELAGYVCAHQMKNTPEERRRCWRLDYADGAQFHLDVLPSVPERIYLPNNEIAITDNQHPDYALISGSWVCCNPLDYAEWFKGRMALQWELRQKELAETLKAHIDDVPEYKIKTSLQRVVQLLKRHRDMTFDGKPDDKPVSILITTLAAQAYDNEADTLEALVSIAARMRDYIEERNGILWVANPVNPSENFADKWQEYPERQEAFFDWLTQVEIDVSEMANASDLADATRSLIKQYGETATNQAIKSAFTRTTSPSLVKEWIERQLLFLAEHRQSPPPSWKMELNPDIRVQVSATVTRRGFRPKSYTSDGEWLPKDASLGFSANTNLKGNYTVYWQVVNTDEEARAAGQLRGGFYETSHVQKGKRIRREATSYRGKHWIECFLLVDNVCVACSGEFIVNIA